MGEEVLFDDLSADEQFKWKSSEHIHPKTKPSHVDHRVIRRKVIQDIALRFIREYQICRYG